jgi:molybdopterin-guanine dinucleotide biosynthesis protein
MTGRALLLTGGLATGKTTVAKEVVAIGSEIGLKVAAIDLDWLGWTTPTSIGVDDLIARNLTVVAANYAAVGFDHLVLARGLVNAVSLESVATTLAEWDLMVVRLEVARPAAEHRIRLRDSGAELEGHLVELDEMARRVAEATPMAPSVINENRSVREVALEVMRTAGWLEG